MDIVVAFDAFYSHLGEFVLSCCDMIIKFFEVHNKYVQQGQSNQCQTPGVKFEEKN